MSFTAEGAFQRPYPFTIDNRASPLDALPAETAYLVGREFHSAGKGFLDNPYRQNTTEFRRYVDGMVDAIIAARDIQSHR